MLLPLRQTIYRFRPKTSPPLPSLRRPPTTAHRSLPPTADRSLPPTAHPPPRLRQYSAVLTRPSPCDSIGLHRCRIPSSGGSAYSGLRTRPSPYSGLRTPVEFPPPAKGSPTPVVISLFGFIATPVLQIPLSGLLKKAKENLKFARGTED
ncbi:PREDICTED: uncharacterized protein LOC109168165 [Ipomoea nil]|uniref:uncharacterized protein LOC109168165 n=1 Tax=Ipomoea nil TaxID=35883 RepID=UPI000901620B|nr:PREDICTED: uncharacterized protein LOC109168165 [Ipomoea nil]